MIFKTVKKLISCALPAWLLLGSGQNLIGSGRFWSVPARFWSVLVCSCYIKYVSFKFWRDLVVGLSIGIP